MYVCTCVRMYLWDAINIQFHLPRGELYGSLVVCFLRTSGHAAFCLAHDKVHSFCLSMRTKRHMCASFLSQNKEPSRWMDGIESAALLLLFFLKKIGLFHTSTYMFVNLGTLFTINVFILNIDLTWNRPWPLFFFFCKKKKVIKLNPHDGRGWERGRIGSWPSSQVNEVMWSINEVRRPSSSLRDKCRRWSPENLLFLILVNNWLFVLHRPYILSRGVNKGKSIHKRDHPHRHLHYHHWQQWR